MPTDFQLLTDSFAPFQPVIFLSTIIKIAVENLLSRNPALKTEFVLLFNFSSAPTTTTKKYIYHIIDIRDNHTYEREIINMQLICNRQSLYEALINVSKAAADKSSIPALEGIKLSLENSTLWLTGYDLEIGIKTSIDVVSSDKADIVVNSRLFSEIIKKMPTDEISISVDENLQMTITGGNTEYSVPVLSADEYPAIPDFETELSFTIPQSVLKDMINQTIFAVSTNDTKPILKGELFEIADNVLNVVAIDGFRLAVGRRLSRRKTTSSSLFPQRPLTRSLSFLRTMTTSPARYLSQRSRWSLTSPATRCSQGFWRESSTTIAALSPRQASQR